MPTPDRFDRAGTAFAQLCRTMAQLRAPGGCPWDAAQTPASLKPYLLEEAYEAIEAIEAGDDAALCEELGDVLLQVVFLAEISATAGGFDVAAVAAGLTAKLVRRHPEVFAAAALPPNGPPAAHAGPHGASAAAGAAGAAVAGVGRAASPGGVADPTERVEAPGGLRAWEAAKAAERPAGRGRLAGVPRALPGLIRAARTAEKAAAAGLDLAGVDEAWAKLDEELAELREAMAGGDRDAISGELGDVIYGAVNLARHLGLDAEEALRGTVDRFHRRFAHVEAAAASAGERLDALARPRLDALWQAAKAATATAG